MALLRISTAKSIAGETNNHCISTFTWWIHAIALPPSMGNSISQSAVTLPLVLPEFDRSIDTIVGSLELMVVPKKKTSPHKHGVRNGPKALKPIPVVIRCKVCGRVKLPHFFCCSGLRDTDGQNGSVDHRLTASFQSYLKSFDRHRITCYADLVYPFIMKFVGLKMIRQ